MAKSTAPKTKTVKKAAPKAASVKTEKTTETKAAGLSVPVFGLDGKSAGHTKLPEGLLAEKVNQKLLAQSVRVFLANQREGGAQTKTRGEVEGSSRKIYRQKGTGKARHGSIRAPIFVGGGVVFGPETHDFHLKLSKSMKRAALKSALLAQSGQVKVIDGLESVEPKTKQVAAVFSAMGITGTTLLVVSKDAKNLVQAARNLSDVDLIAATDLYPYALLTHKHIVFTKKSLEESAKHFAIV